ncbi:glycosyltransferase [Bacteroides xylanisolvens]|uniref:glycosyltransferase n=1 Tax=Bacteroides xylanisolvens TaxID=371601 RepID=UPI00189CF31B|nr:glycosyltransferase [Bacteroides xylanisolvens]
MNKKKVFIAMDTMLCGGIEKSVLSLLYALSPNEVEVTLCLDRMSGEFLPFIPDWVNVVTVGYDSFAKAEKYLGRKRLLKALLKHRYYFKALRTFFIQYKESKLSKDERRIARAKRLYKAASKFNETYDLAVAYANLEQLIYVADNIKALKKITWFHTQLDEQREDIHKYVDWLNQYASFYCVSKALESSLKQTLPQYANKVKFFPHIINMSMMKNWVERKSICWNVSEDGCKILSVGRLAYQKGFDLIPAIASLLKKNGRKFSWFIVGDGAEKEKISEFIRDYEVADCVKLIGVELNPYPYFQECDLYVQTSRYEGYCLTLAEARAFSKPIVSTLFDGSVEQLKDGELGRLTDCNIESLYHAIDEMLSSEELRLSFIRLLEQEETEDMQGVKIFLDEL